MSQRFYLVLLASDNNMITPSISLLHASVVLRCYQSAVKRV